MGGAVSVAVGGRDGRGGGYMRGTWVDGAVGVVDGCSRWVEGQIVEEQVKDCVCKALDNYVHIGKDLYVCAKSGEGGWTMSVGYLSLELFLAYFCTENWHPRTFPGHRSSVYHCQLAEGVRSLD